MNLKVSLLFTILTCIQATAQEKSLSDFSPIPAFQQFGDSLVTLCYESPDRGSAFDTVYSCDFDSNDNIIAERHHGMLGVGSHDAQSYYTYSMQ